MSDTKKVMLTEEGYNKLVEKVNYLKSVRRIEIAERLKAAIALGDLSENSEFDDAKEEQAKNEARITQLTELLRTAQIGEAPDDGKVEPGMIVTCTIAGVERVFLLGSREAAEALEIDVYSANSPLGEAINGLMVGESTSYTAPNGKSFNVKITDVKPYRG